MNNLMSAIPEIFVLTMSCVALLIEAFLGKTVKNLPYINGAFVLGGMVSFNSITDIPLATKTFKKDKEVVLKGDIKCSLTVVQAKNDKGIPDSGPPTELTVSLVGHQMKCHSA